MLVSTEVSKGLQGTLCFSVNSSGLDCPVPLTTSVTPFHSRLYESRRLFSTLVSLRHSAGPLRLSDFTEQSCNQVSQLYPIFKIELDHLLFYGDYVGRVTYLFIVKVIVG